MQAPFVSPTLFQQNFYFVVQDNSSSLSHHIWLKDSRKENEGRKKASPTPKNTLGAIHMSWIH